MSPNVEEIGEGVMALLHPVISHTIVRRMECVTNKVMTVEPLQRATRIMRFGATKCQEANATAPGRSGLYLLVILI